MIGLGFAEIIIAVFILLGIAGGIVAIVLASTRNRKK
jgi:hypothetical protein